MKVFAIDNKQNTIQPKKNISRQTFKNSVLVSHYATELMNINSSEIARTIISNNKELLINKAVREFIAGFLNGVKNSPKTSEYTKKQILLMLKNNFSGFMYLYDGYYRSTEERLQAIEPKCSFSDIADEAQRITEDAMETAVRLATKQGSQHYLPNFLKASKDADGSIDRFVGYQAADLLDKINDSNFREITRRCIYRDKNGNVNRDLLSKTYNSSKDKIWYVINHYGLKTEEDVFKEYEKENLYLPQNFYKLLQELNKNKLIYIDNASILNKEIGDYGKILLILPDIPRTEENKEIYDKMIRFLSTVDEYEFDFNQKDKNGISFIEKVINSENSKLVDMVKSINKKELIYYPELDLAVERVQDSKFKEKLKELDFKFETLEEAARLRSTLLLRKLSEQFGSPLCDKEKMILHLWDIASKQRGEKDSKIEFGKYLCETFLNDISLDNINKLIKEILNFS